MEDGYSMLDTRFSMLDTRFLILDSRYSILDTQFSMLPPSLFYFAGGYVETSYGGQAMLVAR